MYNRFFFWVGVLIIAGLTAFLLRQRSLTSTSGFHIARSLAETKWWVVFGVLFLLVGLGAFRGCPEISFNW